VAETHTPQSLDVTGEYLLYDEFMTRVYLVDALPQERAALRRLLTDLQLDVVGEAADWPTTLVQAPASRAEMLVVDWDLLPAEPSNAVEKLRQACQEVLVIVLISHMDVRQQAATSTGADAFISKSEMPERVANRLRTIAESISIS